MTAMDAQSPSPAAVPAKIQPGRWLGTLLYGRNVDRTAKARARVGLAILAFAAVYAVIGVRLVMFAVAPESHFVRRGASKDAVATARPDIVDRNGMNLDRLKFRECLFLSTGRDAKQPCARSAAGIEIALGIACQRPQIRGRGIVNLFKPRRQRKAPVAAQR